VAANISHDRIRRSIFPPAAGDELAVFFAEVEQDGVCCRTPSPVVRLIAGTLPFRVDGEKIFGRELGAGAGYRSDGLR
jgi:hypothetical protein